MCPVFLQGTVYVGDGMSKYDVFISHASKDKAKYVDKLAEAIRNTGLTVFYDSDCIMWGDSISNKVEDGLKNCERAVVVISKNYFGRKWTEYEIMSLLNRQNNEGKKLIMPILHGVSKKQFVEHYPQLEDVLFKYSKSCSCEELAKRLYDDIKKCE